MQRGEFDAAYTCYDYAIRLDPEAPFELYAAKASALYYLSSQAMSDDVKRLLKQSMDLDPNDRTALMLIATDHFISMRCQQALDAWTQILDSNQKGIIVSLSFIRSTKLNRCSIKLGITSNL